MIVETKKLRLQVYTYTRFAVITERYGNKKVEIHLTSGGDIEWIERTVITGSEHGSSIGAKFMSLREPHINRVYRLHSRKIIGG